MADENSTSQKPEAVPSAASGTADRVALLSTRLTAFGSTAAAVGGGIARMVDGFATLGNEVGTNAERLGVGVDWLQEWQYVAQQFGATNGELASGLKALTLNADEFLTTGGGGAAESFKRLGINAEALRATAGDTEELFALVLSRMNSLEQSAAPRVIDELFGSDGQQLVTLLRQSGDELERLRQAGRDNGAILSQEDVEQSRLYVQQMNELTTVLQSLMNTVLGALLPTINQWLGSLNELAKANRETISQQILQGLQQLATIIRTVAEAITWAAGVMGGLAPLVALVSELFTARFVLSLATSAAALVQFMASVATFAISAIPTAIGALKALSIALFTTPIGWLVLGITALAGAVYLIYSNWGAIADWFGELWQRVKAFFDQGVVAIAQGLASFSPAALLFKAVEAVFELFGAKPLSDLGRDWIDGLAGGITERFEKLLGWLREKIREATLLMPDWMVEGLGLKRPEAPALAGSALPGLGAPMMSNRPSPLLASRYTDVGGELRIRIDSSGNPRVMSMKANGGLGYSVDSGLLGVMP